MCKCCRIHQPVCRRAPTPPIPFYSTPPTGLLGDAREGMPEVAGPQRPPGFQTPQTSSERSGSEGGGAAPRTAKARRRGGKRRGKATVDDIDTLQIRGRVRKGWAGRGLPAAVVYLAFDAGPRGCMHLALPSRFFLPIAYPRLDPAPFPLHHLPCPPQEYREWMNDRSDLLVPRPQRAPAALEGGASAGGDRHAGTTAKSALAVGPATAAFMPGGAWPVELQELFSRNATLPSAEKAVRPSESLLAAEGSWIEAGEWS